MSNILVLGAAGYIGSWAVHYLLESGHNVVGMDNLLYADWYGRVHKNFKFIKGDVRYALHDLHLDDFDAIVHTAAIVGDPSVALHPELAAQTELKTLIYLKKNFKGRIVWPSSASIYGIGEGILTEEARPNPLSKYAQLKVAGEEELRSRPNSVIFRLSTIYGLSDGYTRNRFDLVLNLLSAQAVTTKQLSVFNGGQFRPLLSVRDAARTIADAATDKWFDNCKGDIFNLGERNISIMDLAHTIKSIWPETQISYQATTFQDARNYSVSWEKARQFGFETTDTVEQGIFEVGQFVKEGRVKDISLPRYSNIEWLKSQKISA